MECNLFQTTEGFDANVANLIRKREFKVTRKFVALASMAQLCNLLSGKQVDTPQEALNIIDTVLRELAAQR